MLGLHCCTSFSLVMVSRGCSLVAVLGLLTAVASLVAKHRQALGDTGFRICGSQACGIFLDQGSNRCLLHWQAAELAGWGP